MNAKVARVIPLRRGDVALKLSAEQEKITSLLAKDGLFEGVMRLKTGMKIDGMVIGGVLIESETPCMLFLDKGGVIEGNVLAPRAIICGEVMGSIHAKEILVRNSAKISGDIFYQRIHIEDGAEVNGRLCKMIEKVSATTTIEQPPQPQINHQQHPGAPVSLAS